MLSLRKNKNNLFLLGSTFGIFFLLVLSFLNFTVLQYKRVSVLGVKTSPEDELIYWKTIVEKSPTYRDGYIELARIEFEMGDKLSANNNLEIAKKIDPNSLNLLKTELEVLSSK